MAKIAVHVRARESELSWLEEQASCGASLSPAEALDWVEIMKMMVMQSVPSYQCGQLVAASVACASNLTFHTICWCLSRANAFC